jgi:hypothetical protein
MSDLAKLVVLLLVTALCWAVFIGVCLWVWYHR